MWENYLTSDFVWTTETNAAKKPRTVPHPAPTWSWACSPGKVLLHSEEVGGNDCTWCSSITFQGADITNMGPDGYGCVQSGELRISAHVTVGKVDYKFSPGGIVDQRGVSVHFEENLINELQIRRSLRQPAHGPSFSLQPDYAIWLPGVDHVPPGSEMHCVYTGQSVSYGPYNSDIGWFSAKSNEATAPYLSVWA